MTAQAAPLDERGGLPARPVRRRFPVAWLGLAPFAIFSTLFLVLPTIYLIVASLQDRQGAFTLDNYTGLTDPTNGLNFPDLNAAPFSRARPPANVDLKPSS